MQGFNRYFPPDYDPKDKKHKGNLNRLAGKSAQKPVVRFEMPFNIWCLNCNSHIAQGVRFNAEKKKTGNYFSSPIFSFTMKCHLCSGTIIIATNPKETCYDVLEGAKKKAEEWNAQDTGTLEFSYKSPEEGASDPLYKLEKDATQKASLKESKSRITDLLHVNEKQWSDPYAQSQRLRRAFRTEKHNLSVLAKRREEIQDRHALAIELDDQSITDQVHAKSIDFVNRNREKNVLSKPLFGQRTAVPEVTLNSLAKVDPFRDKGAYNESSPSHKPVKGQEVPILGRTPRERTLVNYSSSDGE